MVSSDLPISTTHTPRDRGELIEVLRDACSLRTPVYPIGGGTSLGYGLPAKVEGIGVSLADLDLVEDYPARDMTITVDAGITMRRLAETLATEQQRLPVDVPSAGDATLGGVVATDFSGPRRFGCGTMRDYVIGIEAVDGCGRPFAGGGRVVKNVAGYDFCKLLTGSLGTLGIINRLTLKLKPAPEQFALLMCPIESWDRAEQLLADLVDSPAAPTIIELVSRGGWEETLHVSGSSSTIAFLIVGLEGTAAEVDWMRDQLLSEWRERRVAGATVIGEDAAPAVWNRLVEFPDEAECPLVLKANVLPSVTTRMMAAFHEIDSECVLQAHAGNGIVIARFAEFPAAGLSRVLVGSLMPIANAADGNIVVLSNPSGAEMTHQSMWGGIQTRFELMNRVKHEFDPYNLLNPDRFVYV